MSISSVEKFSFWFLLTCFILGCAIGEAGAASLKDGDAATFEPVASVVMHPRCMNCHQVDAPKQNDNQTRHDMQIVRGPAGHGVPALQCSACHQTMNTGNDIVPGAAGWHLAPLSANWDGLSKGDICRQMKDPARNGGRRTGEQVMEHMRADPVVLWAWAPGANRSMPPISHDEFMRALTAWKDAGMPCPG
ncbi:MAG TPA: hypothetical protein VIF60_20830 [Burkholderiaceae bacterium]|jgi:hypothetical protein